MINQEIQTLRAAQLDQLKLGLSPEEEDAGKAILILIEGPEGIGKTSLVNELGSQIETGGEALLWIDLSNLKPEDDLLKYPQLLSHSIQTNNPTIKGRVEEAARELGREAFRLEALATQQNAGTAENADPLPDLAKTWSKIFTEKLLGPPKDEAGNDLPIPGAIFMLEDFETFSKPQQLWIKEHLIDTVQVAAENSRIAFLVTTTAEESCNIANFFPSDKFSHTTVPLEPFTEDQVAELLLKISLPEVPPEEFLEQTGGFPARMHEAATDRLNRDLDEDASQVVQQFLAGKTPEQLEWVSVAVLLPEYNEEGFRLYFDELVAQEAYGWLGKQGALVKQSADRAVFDDEMKNSLLQWIRKQDPAQFQARNQMASQYVKLLRKFSSTSSREYLNHLACLNYFDAEDLEFLFGASASDYAQFIQDNPQYFETGGRTQRLSPEYIDLVQEYRALLPSSTTEILTQSAAEYWGDKSNRLQEEKRSLQQKKVVEESKLNELNAQISKLDTLLHRNDEFSDEEREQVAKEERQRRLEEEKHTEVNRRVRGSKRFHSIVNTILILLGVAFFYFGIFSSDGEGASKDLQSSPLVPCIFGVGLIVAGIMRPLRDKITIQKSKLETLLDKQTTREMKKLKKKASTDKDPAQLTPESGEASAGNVPDETSGAEALLLFKRTKIESRAEALQEVVDGLNHALRKIEQVLKEPLVI